MKFDLKETKIVFMGTPDFGAPVLNFLLKESKVVAVVTQPDKKVGREQVISPSPIKQIAVQNKIEVLQPVTLKGNAEFIRRIKDLEPDLIVVVAYGLLLPKEVIAIPKFGVVNVHASLLPKYRGASPIQAAILNGDKRAGVTIMLVDEQLDHGPILSQKDIKISKDETFVALHDKLAALGAKLLLKTLPDYLKSKIKPQEQDQSLATFCQKITKKDGKIDLINQPILIERQVRAYNPWPGTWLDWNGKKLKLLNVMVINDNKHEIDEVFKTKKGFALECIEDALEILQLQLEGKKPMTAKEFLNGYTGIIGSILK